MRLENCARTSLRARVSRRRKILSSTIVLALFASTRRIAMSGLQPGDLAGAGRV
jgi:hypothetical protein